MPGPAGVTAPAPDAGFAATLPREKATGLICVGVTQAALQGTHGVIVTGWRVRVRALRSGVPWRAGVGGKLGPGAHVCRSEGSGGLPGGPGGRRADRACSGAQRCCVDMRRTRLHSRCQMPGTGPCQSGSCGHAHGTRILGEHEKGGDGVGGPMARKARPSGMAPTPAGVGVPRLGGVPWVVLVQVLAALTVGTSCVMAADTKAMHLAGRRASCVGPVPQLALPRPHDAPRSRSPCLPRWLGRQVQACTQRHGRGTGSCLRP